MNTRYLLLACAMAALAACTPAIPNSGAPAGLPDPGRGVGFDNSIEAQRQREAAIAAAQLQTVQAPPAQAAAARPAQVPAQVAQAPRPGTGSNDPDLARVAARADANAAVANSGQQVVNASPSNPAPQILNNPGISNENNFDAVSSRRSIEGDAARIASNRAQYEVVQPTALPNRTEAGQPNVVAYALQTRHPRGTQVHRRVGLNKAAKYARNCAVYASADEAQIDFLARGGPQRDRMGLDPDGDGYACDWDPAPFRRATSGG